MSLLLARTGHGAMSDLSPLCAQEQTLISVAGNAFPLRHELTIGLSFGLALPLAIEGLAESGLSCCYVNNQLP
jgi:hypothetical protein